VPWRVLFVIPSLAQGGAERQILELMRRLDRAELQPILCTFHQDPHYARFLPAGVECHDLGLGAGRGRIAAFRRLVALLRELQPDLVQSFMDQANLWVRLAAPLAGTPAVITSVRGPWMRWRYLLLEALLATRVGRAVVVNSRSTEAEMLSWARVPRERLFVIHNFVDFEHFRPPTAEERLAARARFGFAPDDLVLLLSGRLSPQKHQLGLALALARLRARGALPLRVRVVLAGRPRDAWYARLVPPALRAAGVAGLVQNIGVVPAADGPALYAATDVLLLPSLWEGLPNVALEAQACGVPAVVSDKANVDGIVEDGNTGLVAPLELGMEAYADALGRMIALPPAERQEMGRRGRVRVTALFPPGRALQDWLSLYRAVLGGQPLPAPVQGRLSAALPG
jgi:glycosyltransferase involved in cell wall biosynthesis